MVGLLSGSLTKNRMLLGPGGYLQTINFHGLLPPYCLDAQYVCFPNHANVVKFHVVSHFFLKIATMPTLLRTWISIICCSTPLKRNNSKHLPLKMNWIYVYIFFVPVFSGSFHYTDTMFYKKKPGKLWRWFFFGIVAAVVANLTAVQAPPFPLNLPKASCWSPDGIALAMAIPAMFG